MQVTICDICGRALDSTISVKLPAKDKYNITNYGKTVATFEKDLHLENYDLCEDCLEQVYDFIQFMKENKNDSL